MSKPTASERERALAGLRRFQAEAASLRQALGGYERALERTCRQVEGGAPLHEVLKKIGVGELRADPVARLTRFETARHRMRVACFRMSLADGLSIGEIARLWGISRQLASRLLKEAGEKPPRSSGQTGMGALPPALRTMTTSRPVAKRGKGSRGEKN